MTPVPALPIPPDLLDDPTERFALQTCPACGALTPVCLSLERDLCEACGGALVVASLEA